MRVCRATRLLAKKNFAGSGFSRRVAALHYVPSLVTTSVNNHSIDPVVVENMVRDVVACEALSFTGQVAIILLSLHAKSVQRDLSITCDDGICEATFPSDDDSS
jgi:hypothetical protein